MPYCWKTVTSQDSRIFWVSPRILFLQQRISSRVLKYQLSFKPMNHAIGSRTITISKHQVLTATSWAAESSQGWRCSGGLEFAIYNLRHLKQVKQAETWINALLRIPFVFVQFCFSTRGRWGSPQDRQPHPCRASASSWTTVWQQWHTAAAPERSLTSVDLAEPPISSSLLNVIPTFQATQGF